MTTRVTFLVSFDLPPGATVRQAMEYVHGEIMAGCGALPPAEPMHHLNRESVMTEAAPPVAFPESK